MIVSFKTMRSHVTQLKPRTAKSSPPADGGGDSKKLRVPGKTLGKQIFKGAARNGRKLANSPTLVAKKIRVIVERKREQRNLNREIKKHIENLTS